MGLSIHTREIFVLTVSKRNSIYIYINIKENFYIYTQAKSVLPRVLFPPVPPRRGMYIPSCIYIHTTRIYTRTSRGRVPEEYRCEATRSTPSSPIHPAVPSTNGMYRARKIQKYRRGEPATRSYTSASRRGPSRPIGTTAGRVTPRDSRAIAVVDCGMGGRNTRRNRNEKRETQK